MRNLIFGCQRIIPQVIKHFLTIFKFAPASILNIDENLNITLKIILKIL